jgi:hypothetical protein
VTAWKVTMTPDASDWPEDDLRWPAGFDRGLWREFADETEARGVVNWLADQGWTVTIEPVEGQDDNDQSTADHAR